VSLSLLLEMSASVDAGRVAVVDSDARLTVAQLHALAHGGAGVIASSEAKHVCYVGTGGVHLPLLLFSAARAAVPITPLNYRLSGEGLNQLIDRLLDPLIVADDEYRQVVSGDGRQVMTSAEFLEQAALAEPQVQFPDPEAAAVVLFTSGTTSRPKAVELSHNNLTSYVTGTVEFASAEASDAALICVPPYHIAGVGAALSNLYAGRRMVYLRNFDAAEWIHLVRAESITTATVVPTMLDRIVAELQNQPRPLPTLRNLAYGGSKVPTPLIRKALTLLPEVDFVNAYGLTETSSTIAVLTPQDHRAAVETSDEAIAKRLGSVGRPVPGIEIQIRSESGAECPPGEPGELYVRGAQVSGRYAEIGSVLDEEGWFPTKDIATVDHDGYLFIAGRSDDTIIRGGENISPTELEDVLVEHPDVAQVAVVGAEDPQWGQIIVAVVVPTPGSTPQPGALRDYVRAHLRGSRTPDRIVFRDELPTTATGKVLRRQIADEVTQDATAERAQTSSTS
jgi:acyl-CoA synthetase (AMP-forming)/AMP-acid ligase II